MRRKFWIVLSACVVLLGLVAVAGGAAGVSGLPGSGDAVQAAGATFRLSIPAAAFTPWKSGATVSYENHARFLKHLGPGIPGSLDGHWYIAPIYLPDGVTLTKVIAHWYQKHPGEHGQLKLQRTKFGQGNYTDMAVVDSGGTGGYGSTSTTTISQAVVDNSLYAYWVLFYLPVSGLFFGTQVDVWGCGVQIEYTYPFATYLPAVAK